MCREEAKRHIQPLEGLAARWTVVILFLFWPAVPLPRLGIRLFRNDPSLGLRLQDLREHDSAAVARHSGVTPLEAHQKLILAEATEQGCTWSSPFLIGKTHLAKFSTTGCVCFRKAEGPRALNHTAPKLLWASNGFRR